MFVSHLYVFFGGMLFSFLAHFLTGSFIFLVLSCMSCLCILEINSLPVASVAIIFSHSDGRIRFLNGNQFRQKGNKFVPHDKEKGLFCSGFHLAALKIS